MPRRKEPEEFEDRKQQIMDGALDVFSNKGFEKATNKDIARAAGIGSPGLIYHYFTDKSDLFRQVVERRVPLLQLISHPEEIAELPPDEALNRIGHAYLKILENRKAISLFKLVIGEAARRPRVAQLFNELGPNRVLPFLAGYLQAQMEVGTLQKRDAEIAARCFLGPLILLMLAREIFQQPDSLKLDPKTFLNEHIEIFLNGLKGDAR
jgi:AcrR family transcriptional regulator